MDRTDQILEALRKAVPEDVSFDQLSFTPSILVYYAGANTFQGVVRAIYNVEIYFCPFNDILTTNFKGLPELVQTCAQAIDETRGVIFQSAATFNNRVISGTRFYGNVLVAVDSSPLI